MLATVINVLRPILTTVSLPSLINLYVVVLPKPVAFVVSLTVSAMGSMVILQRPGMDVEAHVKHDSGAVHPGACPLFIFVP